MLQIKQRVAGGSYYWLCKISGGDIWGISLTNIRQTKQACLKMLKIEAGTALNYFLWLFIMHLNILGISWHNFANPFALNGIHTEYS